jgi:hypothetical protein
MKGRPKFRRGQVVAFERFDLVGYASVLKVILRGDRPGWCYLLDHQPLSFPESELRPLTKREIGHEGRT